MEDKLILLLNRGAGKNVKTFLEGTVNIISSDNIYKKECFIQNVTLAVEGCL